MEIMMVKYVVFIKNDDSKLIAKAITKGSVTHSFIQEMKQNRFRKHNVEVDAENEKDAINKINENNKGYLNSLSAFSGNVFFYCAGIIVILIIITLKYFYNS